MTSITEFENFKDMLRKLLIGICIGVSAACSATPRVLIDVPGSNNLKPDAQQSLIAKEVSTLISNYNYKKVPLDDSLSGVIFDNYIKSLDPNRIYFVEEDIKSFEKFRNQLDDDLKVGELATPFFIFNTYQKRYNERINFSSSLLKNPFNFTKNEVYVFDREKMPWYKNMDESNESWSKKIKYDYLNLKIAGKADTAIINSLKKRYESLLSQSNKINSQDAFQVFMSSYTESVDPHTNYFNMANAANFNIDMARSLEGIGATLSSENEFVTIKSIVTGGPADKSKQLTIDDKIIAVGQGANGDFTDVVGWRLDNAISLIRGKKGTVVRLKILSKNQDVSATPKIVSIVREKIILQDQSAKKEIKKVVENGKTYTYGIIEIPAFYADFKAMQAGDANYKSTTRDVKLIIDTLKSKKVDAIVIDLRGNGGGSLLEAIELTGLFIKTGPVVQVRDARNKVEVDEDENPDIAWTGSLAVLTDRFSASASEIFAGAIQDYNRGLIIGNSTYGKGSVQSAIDMSRVNADLGNKGGQINLTTGKFYRISGSSTQHKGVVPDVEFPTVFPADKYGESAEPSAMPWDEIKSSNYKVLGNIKQNIPTLKLAHDERMKNSREYHYLLEDISEFKNKEKEKSLPLNELELKKQRDVEEAKNFIRENERRASRGLPLLKKGESKPKGEKVYDFIKEESLLILTDFIKDAKVAVNTN